MVESEYLTKEGGSVALDAIQAKRIVPMHYTPKDRNTKSIHQQILTRFPDSILFQQTMETRIIQ